MAKKYKKEEILESISKWANYLIESKQMSETEVKEFLGEGLLKTLGSNISRAVKAGAEGLGNAVKATGEAIHDTFLKNDGVKKFLECLKKAGDKDINALKMTAIIGGVNYPVLDLSIPKKFKKVLVLNINPEVKDFKNTLTVGTLREAIKAAGIKKMSAGIDGIVCGTQATTEVNEATAKKAPAKSKKAAEKKQPADGPNFNETPVQTTSGENILIADKNKLLDVKYDGKEFIGFMFDKSKEVKKAEAADDEIFS